MAERDKKIHKLLTGRNLQRIVGDEGLPRRFRNKIPRIPERTPNSSSSTTTGWSAIDNNARKQVSSRTKSDSDSYYASVDPDEVAFTQTDWLDERIHKDHENVAIKRKNHENPATSAKIGFDIPDRERVTDDVDRAAVHVKTQCDFEISFMRHVVNEKRQEGVFGAYNQENLDSSVNSIEIKGENSDENAGDFDDLITREGFFEIINHRVVKSKGEILLLLMKFALRNSLTHTSFCKLLELFNSIFEESILPETRYMVDKYFNDQIGVEFHALCDQCNSYLGEIDTISNLERCTNECCRKKLDLENSSSLNYFVVIDPSEPIKELLTEFEDYYYYVVNKRVKEKDHFKDIYDGKLYRQFVRKLSPEIRKQYLTTVFNTDGAPKFESSNYSIWPIYLMPNEIPIEHRRPIVCGLWFGKGKVDMIPFLGPFKDLINRLSNDGIPCKIKNEDLKIRLFALCSCVDTIARAPMQGVKQFNGYYGCNWCLHNGDRSIGKMCYPYLIPAPELRDPDSTVQNMKIANDTGIATDGVQTASHLINLKYFNIIEGFVPDILHIILGIAEQFSNYFAASLNSEMIALLDKILLRIKAPNQISRLTRAFSDRTHWKAREWENWVLYYSLLLIRLFPSIDRAKVEHWSLFVKSLHILLKTDINLEELNEADEMLHEFVSSIVTVYGSIEPLTYNVHQLLHLARSVLNWGPLWSHSTYEFEAGNKTTLQAIKCAKGVIQQVIRAINLQHCVRKIERLVDPVSLNVLEYCEDLTKNRTLKHHRTSIAVYLGKRLKFSRTFLEKHGLPLNTYGGFKKMAKNNCLYLTSRKVNKRSCNFYAKLRNGTFIKIHTFIVIHQIEGGEVTLCNVICTDPCKSYDPIRRVTNIDSSLIKVETSDIVTICVFIELNDEKYIVQTPNLIHY